MQTDSVSFSLEISNDKAFFVSPAEGVGGVGGLMGIPVHYILILTLRRMDKELNLTISIDQVLLQ